MAFLATIVVLGVLIFVHELGHFWAAKSVGIEVQRFSIGLGPRVWGFVKGETEYVLSAIPLGGYVKMAGMDDEVMERLEGGPVGEPRQKSPRDFDSKPVWARAWVISAGVIMNMLFAMITFTAIAGFWGASAPATTRIGFVDEAYLPIGADELAQAGPGASIVSIGDRPVEHWGDVQDAFLDGPSGATEVVLADPAARLQIVVPSDEMDRRRLTAAVVYWMEPTIGAVTPGSPAARAGLQAEDRIVAVAGEPITSWVRFVEEIRGRPGLETPIQVRRGDSLLGLVVTPDAVEGEADAQGRVVSVGQIGVLQGLDPEVHIAVSPAEAVSIGWRRTVFVTQMIGGFLRDLVTGGVSPRSVGSIVTIGEASGQAAERGLEPFLEFMALFSINLAILNMLPIPVLDGGHLVFLLVEAVRGRPLSVEQRIRLSQAGMFVIIGLMVWALSNDFMRLLGL